MTAAASATPSTPDPDLPLVTPARVRAASVEFRHVTVRYGDERRGAPAALDDLSLNVSTGEICVLVGPSGCGKTTALRLVNRLLQPTSGQVLIDGQDVGALDPVLLRRRIGYVIQQIGLFPHQTIAENVGTVPRLLRWPGQRIRQRVDELLALIGLDPARVRGRYPAQLSGGERQRVGVARALAAEPPLLLMDEPFAAVDPIVRERLQEEFLRLQRALGTTVLFVTHDVDEALKLATRVAVMRQGGRLAQCSPPGELLAFPADEYVARFLGADRTLKRLTVMAAGDLIRWSRPVDDAAEAMPTVSAAAPARDALTAMLTAPARAVVLTDGAGHRLAVATLESVAVALAKPGTPTAPPSATARTAASRPGRAGDGERGEA
jgi:osmoprotectant transport system ATP-binding protein